MKRALVLAACVVAACETPDLRIVYRLADGTAGATCVTSETSASPSCADVPMQCQSVLHLRILRPNDPNAPFVSICEDIRLNAARDMCAIGNVDLPRVELPRETLEVQVTVWPREAVLDPETGDLDCAKVPVEFDATRGFPVAGANNPAFGGRAFYQPGDEETIVTLGCVDVASVNEGTCAGSTDVIVTATVGDFENLPFSVSSTIGDRLTVSVGEPKPFDDGERTGHVLSSANVAILDRKAIAPTPSWEGAANLDFASAACIQVLEDSAQATSALRCKPVNGETMLDLPGVRLPRSTLDQVLASIGAATFPESGMTVGIVLDSVGAPVPNVVVESTAGAVQYLNATRTGLDLGGRTTTSGMFLSRDAPFGTTFSSFQVDQMATGLGGNVDGKVTVVILLFDNPIGG